MEDNIANKAKLSKLMYGINTILLTIWQAFWRNWQADPETHFNIQGPRTNNKDNFEKK